VTSLLVVQNDWDKPIGRVGDALVEQGATLDVRMSSEELPDLDGYDGLILLPGLADPDDDDPAVHRARATIEEALERGLPVLGLCLGGQLLAQALGGETYRSEDERGYREIWATDAAADDPLLRDAPSRFETFHAHAYAFRAPAGATVLYENDVCVQAFRLGPAWAFQFHPEVTVEAVDTLARGVRGEIEGIDPRTVSFFRNAGADPAELEVGARRVAETAHRVALGVARGFVAQCREHSASGCSRA
jgi:GMP synthase-like glutamine amidotransferase